MPSRVGVGFGLSLGEDLREEGLAPFRHLVLHPSRMVLLGTIGELEIIFQIPAQLRPVFCAQRVFERDRREMARQLVVPSPANLDLPIPEVNNVQEVDPLPAN
jgi:hypothetical protein